MTTKGFPGIYKCNSSSVLKQVNIAISANSAIVTVHSSIIGVSVALYLCAKELDFNT